MKFSRTHVRFSRCTDEIFALRSGRAIRTRAQRGASAHVANWFQDAFCSLGAGSFSARTVHLCSGSLWMRPAVRAVPCRQFRGADHRVKAPLLSLARKLCGRVQMFRFVGTSCHGCATRDEGRTALLRKSSARARAPALREKTQPGKSLAAALRPQLSRLRVHRAGVALPTTASSTPVSPRPFFRDMRVHAANARCAQGDRCARHKRPPYAHAHFG